MAGAMFVVAGLAVYTLSNRFRRRMDIVIDVILGLTCAFLIIRMALSEEWAAWQALLASLALFGLAHLCWTMDRAKTFPLKRWRHGLWHVLTAVASGMVFCAAHWLGLQTI